MKLALVEGHCWTMLPLSDVSDVHLGWSCGGMCIGGDSSGNCDGSRSSNTVVREKVVQYVAQLQTSWTVPMKKPLRCNRTSQPTSWSQFLELLYIVGRDFPCLDELFCFAAEAAWRCPLLYWNCQCRWGLHAGIA